MYRVLIVDDESNIVDWLYELFKGIYEKELDIYKAYSGTEALDWLNRTKIDIVLTDIRMPGMNGFQLVEKIRESWPECKVIFLTGYDEFDYVYTAIKYEGISYLLKTEDDEEIIKALEKAIDQIDKSHKMEEMVVRAKEQISLALPLLQKEYINSLLYEESESSDVEQGQFDAMEIPLKADLPIVLLFGRIDNMPEKISAMKKNEYKYSINLIVEKYLSPRTEIFFVTQEPNSMLWILQPKIHAINTVDINLDSRLWERTVLFVRETLENIQAACKESLNLSTSYVMNDTPFPWNQISQKFNYLKTLLDYRIGAGSEMILSDKYFNSVEDEYDTEKDLILRQVRLRLNKTGVLGNYLEQGQKAEFFKLLSELTEYLKGIPSLHYNPALEVYYTISLTILSYINRMNLTEKIAFKIGLNKLTSVEEHGTWNNAVEYLYQLSEIIFEYQNIQQDKRTSEAIMRVQQYICSHLNEDLSLVKLAEQVYFNPSYLSRLFKNVTGITISEYISMQKLEKAKELLTKGNLKIHEVAEAVGYNSSSYFAHFFKKMTGMYPQEYRDYSQQVKGKQ